MNKLRLRAAQPAWLVYMYAVCSWWAWCDGNYGDKRWQSHWRTPSVIAVIYSACFHCRCSAMRCGNNSRQPPLTQALCSIIGDKIIHGRWSIRACCGLPQSILAPVRVCVFVIQCLALLYHFTQTSRWMQYN